MAKKILVIGGGSGIGRQIVNDLIAENYEVIAASRNIEEADLPEGVSAQKFDVTSDDELDLPDELVGLVYCPGTINLKPFDRYKIENIQEELEINYLGAVRVLRQGIEPLKKGKGSAVFFSTVAVQTGLPFHSTVSAVKGAVEGMVRALAAEYAPKIRFNGIALSLTDTPLAEQLLSSDKKRENNADRHPMKTIGEPKDASAAALFLLTEKSRWITGQILKVDGGMSALRSL